MIDRPFWRNKLYEAWQHASIAWLTGVRRVGKTVLAQSLPDAELVNSTRHLDALETRGLAAFRASYPKGRNYVVTPSAVEPFPLSMGAFSWAVTPIGHLRQAVGSDLSD